MNLIYAILLVLLILWLVGQPLGLRPITIPAGFDVVTIIVIIILVVLLVRGL